jgi:hypothetical protein
VHLSDDGVVGSAIPPLPDHGGDEVVTTEDLVKYGSAIRHLGIVEGNPDRPIRRQQVPNLDQSIAHHVSQTECSSASS